MKIASRDLAGSRSTNSTYTTNPVCRMRDKQAAESLAGRCRGKRQVLLDGEPVVHSAQVMVEVVKNVSSNAGELDDVGGFLGQELLSRNC